MSDEVFNRAAELLGCQWGRGISTPSDRELCASTAVQIVVLHGGPQGPVSVKLCDPHREIVYTQTTPREGKPSE